MWRRLAGAILGLRSSARAVPDVPFIKREPQLLLRALVTTDQIADGKRFVDLAVHREVHSNKFFATAASVLRRVSEIAMQRKTVYVVIALLQHFAVPFEIGGHERSARSAGDQSERRIYIAH